ncbi:MAG: tRNA (N6-isopentenyl adenosine(37)-C2)-methylthiotransferase MiaB [Anaerolineae bacterium]|nr:tRNA (N6-isopentenyl adenosine(37)-C2)-methylthiotransferase MiaB [Anaerolineae bacterium]
MEDRTYFIWTIGCQMNVGDSRRLAELLATRGYREAEDVESADLIVLNTCVVRQSAEDRVLGRLASLKPLKDRRPEVTLAVMGCLVGVDGRDNDLATRFPYVDLWLPPSSHEQLAELVSERPGRAPTPSPSSVSRYVTIMQGCDNFCSYCIVPYRRGRERSRPVGEIVAEVEELASRGAREVTLLGQNVDSYGRDLPGQPSLAHLLHQVHPVDGIVRLRFLTNHPKDMSQELIETVAELPKVCEHLELPLQSGSDEILKRMNRHYTREQYLELVQRIKVTIPGVALATDVIVGFPGETRAQFQETYDLLEEVGFSAIHVACYSPRAGTAAARLEDDVPPEEKEERRRQVEQLLERQAGEQNRALLGQTVEVLVEERVRGKWRGRTRTNKLVFLDSPEDLRGALVDAVITWTGPWSMQGRLRYSVQAGG